MRIIKIDDNQIFDDEEGKVGKPGIEIIRINR
jgi:hypothetical protein